MHFPPSLQKGKTYQFQSQSFKKLLHVHVGANVHHVHYARTYGVVWGWIPHHQHVHQMTERMILQHSWITDDADVIQAFFH